MAIPIPHPTPLLCLQHSRFTSGTGWRLYDLCVGETDVIAVSGYHSHTDRTFIDLYNNFSDREKPNIPSSIEFEPHAGLKFRFVSFPEQIDRIVTCIGDQLEILATTAENKTLKHQVLKGLVGNLNTGGGKIFVGLDNSNMINVYDQQLNIVNVINLNGIPPRDRCMDIHFTSDACFVCTRNGRAMKLSTRDGNALYDFDVSTRETAQGLAVSDGLGVVFIVWQWNEIRVYSIEENKQILVFDVDDVVYRIRVSDKGTIVTGNHYTGEVKFYNVADLFNYDQLKQTLSHLLTKDHCAKLANFLDVDLQLESSTGSVGEILFDVLESRGIVEPHNVERLSEVLLKLEMKSPYGHITDIFQKLRPLSIVQPKKLSSIPLVAGGTSEFVSLTDGDPNTKRVNTITSKSGTDPTTKKKYKVLPKENASNVNDEELQTDSSTSSGDYMWKRHPKRHLFAEKYVDSKGSRLDIGETGISLEIPPNALKSAVKVRVSVADHSEMPPPPDGLPIVTPVVQCHPRGLTFGRPVTLSLPHCSVIGCNTDPKVICYYGYHESESQLKWTRLEGTVTSLSERMCTISFNHFCHFACSIANQVSKRLRVFPMCKTLNDNVTLNIWMCEDLHSSYVRLLESEEEVKYHRTESWESFIIDEEKGDVQVSLKELNDGGKKNINLSQVWKGQRQKAIFTFKLSTMQSEDVISLSIKQQSNDESGVEFIIQLQELHERVLQQTSKTSPSERKALRRVTNLAWDLHDLTIQFLSNELIDDQCKQVCRSLDIKDSELSHVQSNHHTTKERNFQSLLKWKQLKSSEATFGRLSDALRSEGRTDLAERVLKLADLFNEEAGSKEGTKDSELIPGKKKGKGKQVYAEDCQSGKDDEQEVRKGFDVRSPSTRYMTEQMRTKTREDEEHRVEAENMREEKIKKKKKKKKKRKEERGEEGERALEGEMQTYGEGGAKDNTAIGDGEEEREERVTQDPKRMKVPGKMKSSKAHMKRKRREMVASEEIYESD